MGWLWSNDTLMLIVEILILDVDDFQLFTKSEVAHFDNISHMFVVKALAISITEKVMLSKIVWYTVREKSIGFTVFWDFDLLRNNEGFII
jgi:hypothetical protein